MSANELYLIRHGESRMNINSHLIGGRSNETPLTERGIEQSRLLGRYFAENAIIPSHVFASPAVRTLQTARYVLGAMELSVDPIVAEDIQEMDQGMHVGRDREDVYTPAILQAIDEQGKDFKLEGAESMNDVGMRMLRWIEMNVPILNAMDVNRTFVFGHSVAIRSLVSTMHNWTHRQTLEAATENTSFTMLDDESGKWGLNQFGAAPHLE
jgi:broad specificity phosphatase PhoE